MPKPKRPVVIDTPFSTPEQTARILGVPLFRVKEIVALLKLKQK
jgi:hypothetical protein